MSLLDKEDLLAAVSIVSEIGKAGKIKSPKDKEVVMVEDEDDLMEWVEDIDLDTFLESLEGKVDDDILDLFEGLTNGAGLLQGIGGSLDDYYYDDEYWYDEYEDDWY